MTGRYKLKIAKKVVLRELKPEIAEKERSEKEKKEDATLALIKEMANKKNEPAPSGTWRERMMCRTEGDEAGEDGADESGRLGGHAGERGQEEGRESEESGEEGEERWVG